MSTDEATGFPDCYCCYYAFRKAVVQVINSASFRPCTRMELHGDEHCAADVDRISVERLKSVHRKTLVQSVPQKECQNEISRSRDEAKSSLQFVLSVGASPSKRSKTTPSPKTFRLGGPALFRPAERPEYLSRNRSREFAETRPSEGNYGM